MWKSEFISINPKDVFEFMTRPIVSQKPSAAEAEGRLPKSFRIGLPGPIMFGFGHCLQKVKTFQVPYLL
jgi:hypothetical protein